MKSNATEFYSVGLTALLLEFLRQAIGWLAGEAWEGIKAGAKAMSG